MQDIKIKNTFSGELKCPTKKVALGFQGQPIKLTQSIKANQSLMRI